MLSTFNTRYVSVSVRGIGPRALLRSERSDALTAQINAGAASGCRQLVRQATEICRENANKCTGLAQSAAASACEVAGF